MKTSCLLLVWATAAIAILKVAPCQAGPRKPIDTYDQRQDGDLNVHAKFENLLIVVVPSTAAENADLSSLLENNLVAQALGLKDIASRVASHPKNAEIYARPEDSTDSAAESSTPRINSQEVGAENAEETGTSVKLIAIVQKELPDAVASSQSTQPSLKTEKRKIITQAEGEALDDGETSKKTARSLLKISSELSVSKLPPGTIDQQIPLENKVSGIGLDDRGNAVGQAETEPQELKLLGATENCGPDRFRDRFGLCRFRVDA